MKNVLFVVVMLACSINCNLTFSQQFGIKGGVNSSDARLTDYDFELLSHYNTSPTTSNYYGFFYRINKFNNEPDETHLFVRLVEKLSVNVELLYMENGFLLDRFK